MQDAILLTTLNARYSHSSLGLRYLKANLGELSSRSYILEFEISQRPIDICEQIVRRNPAIIGLGVYIWNARESLDLVALLRKVIPQAVIIIGGPEVSYEVESQDIVTQADYVICGEGDIAFRELCAQLLSGERPSEKIINAQIPEVNQLELPYHLYTEQDIANRVLYVEASRGCPFRCEFCLSSLEIPVRQFALESFLSQMESLIMRGARQFKFVDRTFNLHLKTSSAILEFFLNRTEASLFVHFEMVPDRLPEALRAIIKKFPPGALQFEVGIQSFNPEVNNRIRRKQDNDKLEENIRFLRTETGVHIHADLIIGLPGESVDSFAAGFNRLVGINPHEIQVGVLKRLRGTPITAHDSEWEMRYADHAPYEILSNKLIPFDLMQRLKRFSRYWDLVSNSGNFVITRDLLWSNSRDPFATFLRFSDWMFEHTGARHGISLHNLADMLRGFLIEIENLDQGLVLGAIQQDYQRLGRNDVPRFLNTNGSHRKPEHRGLSFGERGRLKRQERHAS